MQSYDKKGFSLIDYEKFINIQKQNKTTFKEHLIGSRRKLFVYDKLVATTSSNTTLPLGNLSKQGFNAFLGMFNRNLYKSFLSNESLYYLKIKHKGFARGKNIQGWQNIEKDEFFYNVDLSSAYWQITYKLGYINKKVFEKYMYLDDYKQAKRYCISFLARSNKMMFSNKGENYIINCDTSVLKLVYDNIRNKLYEIINTIVIDIQDYVEFNIDGITIHSKDLDTVINKFNSMGLIYKINICRKLNDNQYMQKGVVRSFKMKV